MLKPSSRHESYSVILLAADLRGETSSDELIYDPQGGHDFTPAANRCWYVPQVGCWTAIVRSKPIVADIAAPPEDTHDSQVPVSLKRAQESGETDLGCNTNRADHTHN